MDQSEPILNSYGAFHCRLPLCIVYTVINHTYTLKCDSSVSLLYQRIRLKIKQVVDLQFISCLTKNIPVMSYQHMYGMECDFNILNFVQFCFSVCQFQMPILTVSCLLPRTHFHRSCDIIPVISVSVFCIADSIVTNCQPYSHHLPIHISFIFQSYRSDFKNQHRSTIEEIKHDC
jgi:hypothetical protein